MKKLLFLFFGIFPLNFIVGNAVEYGPQSGSVDLIHNGRQISLKGKGSNKTTRTLNSYSIEAFLEKKVLFLNFLSKLSNVAVTVTNVDTNDILYQDTLIVYIGILSIDLSTEKNGNYKLELISIDNDLSGYFVLK